MDDLIAALNLVRPYMNEYELDYPIHCGHEVLYLNVDPGSIPYSLHDQLEALSFDYDDEVGLFASYRLGSA